MSRVRIAYFPRKHSANPAPLSIRVSPHIKRHAMKAAESAARAARRAERKAR